MEMIMSNTDAGKVIAELQSLGVKIDRSGPSRKGGAGPAEGGYVIIDDLVAAVPFASEYVSQSPYVIRKHEGSTWLFKNGDIVCPVGLVDRPRFYEYRTKDGIPYWKIALLHGCNCLASSVIQTCMLWNTEKRCKFCGIEISLNSGATIRVKQPHHLAEVAERAKSLDLVSHVVLTTGAAIPPMTEIAVLSNCAREIKKKTGLPIHVQCLPPSDPNLLEKLKEAGADTIGLHVESFDEEVLSRVAPFKAAIGFGRYESAWKEAVRIFGVNQVSSFIIAGLGEKDESIIRGSEWLADLGVYPFVVPLRPIPGSLMAGERPPSTERMVALYEEISEILKIKGLKASRCRAGCVRCGACSGLLAFEEDSELVCHPCRTEQEVATALEIRNEVFVKEQKMFKYSDLDENDKKSILLVVKKGEQILGTVRVYPENDNGHWVGGRLAVKKGFRTTGAGKILVKEAVKYVKRQGCTRFTAHIQKKNVPFFMHLGWKPVGPVEKYFGRPHQLMEAEI